LRQTGVSWPVIDGLLNVNGRDEKMAKLKQHLKKMKRTTKAAIKKLKEPESTPDDSDALPELPPAPPVKVIPPAPPGDVTQIVTVQNVTCKMCGAINSFRKLGGFRNFGIMTVAYSRCQNCGHKAQIRRV